ncbi:MAG TPA: hypothetical protein VFG20_01180, partial [Planctomycetaceae bacterium]|nr:hypothetical protein [Planctomycetaceae bacterium]
MNNLDQGQDSGAAESVAFILADRTRPLKRHWNRVEVRLHKLTEMQCKMMNEKCKVQNERGCDRVPEFSRDAQRSAPLR